MIWIFFFSNLKWDSKLTTSVKTLHFKKVYVYLKLLFLLLRWAIFQFLDFKFGLSSKSYNSAWQQDDRTDHWYFRSIAQVFFTAVDFPFDGFPWGDNLFAILLAAVRWSGTSFDKGFCCHAWDLSFYIHFSTTVLTVQTGYLFCTFFFAVIPALNRSKQRHIRSISGHNLENGNKYKNIINSLNLEGLPTQLSHSNNSIFLFFGA